MGNNVYLFTTREMAVTCRPCRTQPPRINRTNTHDICRRSDVADPHGTNQAMPHEGQNSPTASLFPRSGHGLGPLNPRTCRWTHVSRRYSCWCMGIACELAALSARAWVGLDRRMRRWTSELGSREFGPELLRSLFFSFLVFSWVGRIRRG